MNEWGRVEETSEPGMKERIESTADHLVDLGDNIEMNRSLQKGVFESCEIVRGAGCCPNLKVVTGPGA